jgi:hypothetical protein
MGLLVMIIGGVITFFGREEAFGTLEIGDEIQIPGGYSMILKDFEFLKYENGSPRDWISTVDVYRGDRIIVESYPIEVNRPLKVGNVKLYQSSYKIYSYISLSDEEGRHYRLSAGQMIALNDEGYILKDVISENSNPSLSIAQFDHWKDNKIINHLNFRISEKIGIYEILSMERTMVTGLQMVRDPGYYPVLAGLLLLALGLFTTYFQKIYEG